MTPIDQHESSEYKWFGKDGFELSLKLYKNTNQVRLALINDIFDIPLLIITLHNVTSIIVHGESLEILSNKITFSLILEPNISISLLIR